MLHAIRQVAQGKHLLDPLATSVVMQQAYGNDPLDALTVHEREVFDLLARGCNHTEIAQHMGVSKATIQTLSANVLDKLVLRDRAQVIVYELKRGLVCPAELL
jgi:DNA-binding NarL/FixJ family response regulator